MRDSIKGPSYYVASVSDISAQFLIDQGIRKVVLDLDNALTPVYSWRVDKKRAEWVARLCRAGLTVQIASHVPHWFPFRVKRIGRQLGIKANTVNKKSQAEFQRFLQAEQFDPKETVIIDDQLLRGIQAGIESGLAMTILVKPITKWEMPTTMRRRQEEQKWIEKFGLRLSKL